MTDIYVLNKNLETVGIVDSYKSLIWANRYNTVGDCELYVPASDEYLSLLQKGYYLMRLDDDMVCQIKKIELDTDAENGNYLTVTGYDVKRFLDQRIIWSTMNCDGNVEDFIRSMVNNTLGNASLSARQITDDNGNRIFYLGDKANFSQVTTEQVTYKNVGEKVRDYCLKYGWGYRVVFTNNLFYFQLYNGTDRTEEVIFSNDYENLNTTTYTEDETNMGNVALVAGEGEGSERSRNVSGYAESTERYEIYVDAKDISKTITWENLTDLFPTTDSGGQGYISGNATSGWTYNLNYLNVQIVDSDQLTNLQNTYPDGHLITIDGNQYYQIYNEVVADLPSNSLTDSDSVVLRDVVYSVYLLTRGYEKLAEYGAVTSFEGTIEPNTTFVYKQDYFLGDIVTVENEFGISASARIVEVIEVDDDNGYNIEPKFEWLDIYGDLNAYILSHDEAVILTEDNAGLIVENSFSRTSPVGNVRTGVKISQLNEATTALDETHFFPVASDSETLKVAYTTLVDQLREDTERTNDYEDLSNKPSINNVTLIQNKSLDDLNIQVKMTSITNSEIDAIAT